MDIFSSGSSLSPVPLPDGELAWLQQLPLPYTNGEVLARLIAETDWREETVLVYGKRHLQPRLSAWYGEAGYRYSGLSLAPAPLTPLLETLRGAVQDVTGHHFNSVLLNYYRNGQDSMGMHADDEASLGPAPVIASLSFGATRTFILRHKRSKQTLKMDLSDGSLLLMSGGTQIHWLHGINKTAKPVGPRVNLTFRKII
ncbi:alpha-ketoglutarate-dependent dioxygenase AlkB [Massilia sp. KIM]|nr:alpha-ketoglutarate-dependent dioxygenase AlkB [Massilia sp. KIM]